MLVGRPAFGIAGDADCAAHDIAAYVAKPTLQWPAGVPSDAREFVSALLTPDVDKRLVSPAVRNHPFFAHVAWDSVLAQRYDAPWIPPPMRFPGDVANFDLYLRLEGATVVGRGAAARILHEKPPPLPRAFTDPTALVERDGATALRRSLTASEAGALSKRLGSAEGDAPSLGSLKPTTPGALKPTTPGALTANVDSDGACPTPTSVNTVRPLPQGSRRRSSMECSHLPATAASVTQPPPETPEGVARSTGTGPMEAPAAAAPPRGAIEERSTTGADKSEDGAAHFDVTAEVASPIATLPLPAILGAQGTPLAAVRPLPPSPAVADDESSHRHFARDTANSVPGEAATGLDVE